MNPNIIQQFALAARGLPQPQRAQLAHQANPDAGKLSGKAVPGGQ